MSGRSSAVTTAAMPGAFLASVTSSSRTWPEADGDLTIRAVPAMHGPVDGARDADGHVNCEVTGFVLAADGVPTVYLSGDNASIGVVAEVARRVGPIEVAVLFIGAGLEADGLANGLEGLGRVVEAFDEAGLSDVLRTADPGSWAINRPIAETSWPWA